MPQPLKFEKWIQHTEKSQVIKVFNKCITLRELQREVGYPSKTTTDLRPRIPNLLKKYNITYDFEYWLKTRDYINNPSGKRHAYVKWFIENGKEKLIYILDKSIYQLDVAKEFGLSWGFRGRRTTGWEKFKKYCLQFIKYNFDKWEKRNNIDRKTQIRNQQTLAKLAIKNKFSKRNYTMFSFYSKKRIAGTVLRPHLIYCGLEYKCCKCGINPNGHHPHGQHFSLHVEHIDGNPNNNTFIFDIEKQKKLNPNIGKTNLCFLCPNCHNNETNRKMREKSERTRMSNEDINVLNN